MTNPTHSVFTVTVDFKGTFYDVEITPTWNDLPIVWLQDHVDRWTSAERTHQLFSKKIVEMLNRMDIPADYSLATHGVIRVGSAEGFIFDKGLEISHKTQDVWEDFIECLRDPVTQSHIAGDPIDEEDEVVGTGLGARVKFTQNDYLKLPADAQKAVRLSLFQKKCYEHFAGKNKVDISDRIEEYTSSEKACLAHLFPSRRKETPGREAFLICEMQSEEEKSKMAPHVQRIRKEMKQIALERQRAALVESDDEALTSNDDLFYDTASNDIDSD